MIDVLPGAARLVVGVSGSPASLHALRYARLAAASSGAQIAAVHAWVPPGGDLAERRCPSAALRRAWAAAAGTRLTDAIDAAWGGLPPDLDVELVIIRAEPGPALVQVADSARDLLVVGAGQRGALRRMWRGKVSRYCLAHAQCPVLALPQPATPREMGIGRGGWLLHRRELTLDQALRDWGTAAQAAIGIDVRVIARRSATEPQSHGAGDEKLAGMDMTLNEEQVQLAQPGGADPSSLSPCGGGGGDRTHG